MLLTKLASIQHILWEIMEEYGVDPEPVFRRVNLDPDLLFFAGDQSYDHREHTAAWLKFGLQFRDVFRDMAIPFGSVERDPHVRTEWCDRQPTPIGAPSGSPASPIEEDR